MFKLVIQDDDKKTTVVPLIRDEITIGRKEGNTIRLTERNVSRRHARILRNNGEVHIEDLNSYNGIRVNNARIAERVSLRVSDEVQIGDYKLYLKAEGQEQVADGALTSPVDRVDGVGQQLAAQVVPPAMPASEAMPVATPAATAPHPVTPAPAQLVGSPARTMVALSDNDATNPRSIGPATQEAIDALKRPTGYGRLVVLSSNFAGKEFELSRPQMIVGRTDENDIVVNHRSISRNHAKLVREPETSRYTISDLQSSNGVRVNGQDYGKVELRRGDIVDLGHVRLRFVDAGEDFVFARDAVITDVPEAGGKRGMLMAIIAAVLVVAAGIVVYSMHGSNPTPPGDHKEGSNPPPNTGTGVAEIATPDAAAGDTTQATVPPTTPPDSDQARKCVELQANRKWQELLDCATALSAQGQKDKSLGFHDTAIRETANEKLDNQVRADLRSGALKDAQTDLKKIGAESVYFHDLETQFDKADAPNIEDARRKAAIFQAQHDCGGLKRMQTQESGANGTEKVVKIINEAVGKCLTEKANAVDVVAAHPPGHGSAAAIVPTPGPGSAVAVLPPTAGKCDQATVDDWITQASNQYSSGYATAALSLITKAIQCKGDVRTYRFAATYACAAHDAAAAKLYFNKVPTAFQAAIQQKCQQEHTDLGIQPQ